MKLTCFGEQWILDGLSWQTKMKLKKEESENVNIPNQSFLISCEYIYKYDCRVKTMNRCINLRLINACYRAYGKP